MIKHVALLTTSYPDGKPGSEAAGAFVRDFAQELSTKVRVTVITPSRKNETTTEGDLITRRFSVPKLPLSLLNPSNPAHWWPILMTLRRGHKATTWVAEHDRPDHIFALWALPSGYWAHAVLKRYGVPYSVWALGSDIWVFGNLPVVRNKLRQVLRRAHKCYADGHGLALQVRKRSGRECGFLPSTRNIGAMRSPQMSKPPPYKLAFLGRWHPNKGVDLLLDALEELAETDWEKVSEVRIHGGGPLAEVVNAKTENLRMQDKPVYAGGYLDQSKAAELIRWADYLLLPSRIESIPVVFSDAAKIGTPLVATPVGDLPQLFELYRFGELAAEATSNAFCRAIRSALGRDPSDFSSGLSQAAADFDLPVIVDRFLNHLGNRNPASGDDSS